jgi:hypothetical protein
MLAYNGSIPGPTLKVPEGSTVTVHVTNHGDLDATVHWHGLRLENRYDGTHETMIDRHYGHLARDGRDHAINLLDAYNCPGEADVHQVDVAWTSAARSPPQPTEEGF